MSFPHLKHVRHRLYPRLRHGRNLKAYLAAKITQLAASATGQTVSVVHVANVDATGLLTFTTQPGNGDTVIIGTQTYTFKTTLSTGPTVPNEILCGADVAASEANLIAAVNAASGIGTTYSTGTTANASATAVDASGNAALTSVAHGADGNSVVTSAVSTHISFGGAFLSGGVTELFGPTWTATSHNFHDGEGPVLLTNSGGALPAGARTTELFVHVVDANTIEFGTSLGALRKADYMTVTGLGTGTHTAKRAVDTQGMFELLKSNAAATIDAAADVDSLK